MSPKKFWVQQNFGSSKVNLVYEKIGVKRFVGPIIFLVENNFALNVNNRDPNK